MVEHAATSVSLWLGNRMELIQGKVHAAALLILFRLDGIPFGSGPSPFIKNPT
jgi:hypothetical protein